MGFEYGILFAILSPLLSSISTIFISGATKLLTPLLVASLSQILGSAIILSYIFLSRQKIDLKKLGANKKDLIKVILLRGIIGAGIFVYGLSLTTAVKAMLFTKIEPYFVLGWHWLLLREKIKTNHLILLAIHFIGAMILSTGGDIQVGAAQIGDILIIISMSLFALSYIYSKNLTSGIGAKASNALTTGVGGLVLLPFALLTAPSSIGSLPSLGWMYMLLYVIMFDVFGLTLWFASLKMVKGWIVSALRSIGPLVGIPIAIMFFGEALNPIQIVGGIVVLATSTLIALEHFKKENNKEKT